MTSGAPDRVVAGVGGAGTGTAAAGGGLIVGPETTLGKILLLASPVMTAVVTSALYYLHVSVNRWFEDREASRARATLQKAIANPDIPDTDKEEFRELLANFERTQIVRVIERVEAVAESTSP
jgi:hypothetical protein